MFQIEPFYDPATYTLTYLVYDPETREALVIDPVLDYDPLASQTSTASADRIIAFVRGKHLNLRWVLETHAHADHLSASQYLKNTLGAKVAIGERIKEVQATFKHIFDLPDSFPTDGSQFDRLLRDGEVLLVGPFRVEVIATPGHTPACVTYKIEDAIFTGDALFLEDYGTGRCDFPRGSAADLYTSIHERLYALPDNTRVFVGHDYQPGGRPMRYETTLGIEKRHNVQLTMETTREQFIEFRTKRDATLQQPRLLFPSIQVNVDGGRLPEPHANGIRYLQTPLNLQQPTRNDGSPLKEGILG
ncbi:MAG: MBL fold metallo-hydrolase [Myxococcales bacterium]|nr:MBL fold metallo-hydrolase [Polyangiaceae bacterium]MDW8251147.1 MBL fold metallo-hydrolase [Myxococcales bacterium]